MNLFFAFMCHENSQEFDEKWQDFNFSSVSFVPKKREKNSRFLSFTYIQPSPV